MEVIFRYILLTRVSLSDKKKFTVILYINQERKVNKKN